MSRDDFMVETFSSFEDMVAFMGANIKKAMERATDEQKAITYGNYWMRLFSSYGDTFPIFGYIQTLEQMDAECARLGGTKTECAEERKATEEDHANGMRFGRAYSVVVPEGELGSTHIVDMTPITEEQFKEAQKYNWSHEALMENLVPWYVNFFYMYGDII